MKLKYLLSAVILFTIYIWGSYQQSDKVNNDMLPGDQSAYLIYAKKISQTNFQHQGSRNRMPAYPALISLFYKNGMSDQNFFEKAKKVNTAISIIVLIIFYIILSKYACSFDSITAVMTTAFTVFVYKAPYVQAELLFYCMFFLLFVLISSQLSRPRLQTAFIAGLMAGLAHLTKASIFPALILCLIILTGIFFNNIYKRFFLKNTQNVPSSKTIFTPVLCGLIIVIVFLTVVSPYIINSKKHYGEYFYNVNTTFYMWYDSWEETKTGTRSFGDRTGWPDMPENKIPSFRKYIREHTSQQIFTRFYSGIIKTVNNICCSYGLIIFLLIYTIFLSAIFFQNRHNTHLRQDINKNTAKIIFYIMFFTCYFLSYAWYTPISSGKRFILTLFMPFLFIVVQLITYSRKHNLSFCFATKTIHSSALSRYILISLAIYLIAAFPFLVTYIYGGS